MTVNGNLHCARITVELQSFKRGSRELHRKTAKDMDSRLVWYTLVNDGAPKDGADSGVYEATVPLQDVSSRGHDQLLASLVLIEHMYM